MERSLHPENNLQVKKTNKRILFFIPFIVFVILLIPPIIFSRYTYQSITQQQRIKFDKDTNILQNALTTRIQIYLTAMYGVQGLFAASNLVERSEFITYLNTADIQRKFPGISGFSFTQHVLAKDKQIFIDTVRKDTSATSSGYPDFTINPPGDRQDYYVVTYTSASNPVSSGLSTFGRDFLIDKERGETIRKAVDFGKPVATSEITLFGNPPRKGFIIFMPIYKNHMPTATIQQRRDAVLGVINGVFSTDDLFQTILSEQKIPHIDFEIYDTEETQMLTKDNLLYDSNTHDGLPEFFQDKQINVGERNWTIHLSALRGYGVGITDAYLPASIIAGGVLFSLLISITLSLLLNSRAREVILAEEMTKELRQKKEEYRTIFETLQDVYYRTDVDGKIITISPSIEHYIGIPQKEMIGRNALEFYFDNEDRRKMLQALREKGSISDYSLTLKGKGQQPIYVSLTAQVLFDEQKKPIGLEGILRDVTERNKFEKQLQETNKQLEEERTKLNAILDNMAEGLVVADKEGKFTNFNYAAEKMIGVGLSQSVPEEWGKIYGVFLPDKITPFPTKEFPILRALNGEETHGIEQYIKNEKLKEGIFISVSGSPLRDNQDQIAGSIAVFNDITKRKETEVRLSQEKAKDEAILASIGDGIIMIDKDGKILLINQAAETMLGWTSHEMVGKTISEIPIEDEKHISLENEIRPLIKTLSSAQKAVGTYFYERRDKTKLPISLTVAPVVLNDTVIGAIEVFRDVTHEKELEQMKDEFLSIASHELRTPMTAINGLVAMIKEGDYGPVNEELKVPLNDIGDSTQRLIFLVNDLLNVSRIEAGRIRFVLSTFSPTEIIKTAVHLLQPLAMGKDTMLQVELSDTPEVQADSEKVKQILNNLLGNALKFTDKGRVTVSVKEMQETVIVTVADTGMGIAPEDQTKLFSKFQQISSQQAGKPQGTGLGLYISQQLVRKMGGDLWIQHSELGKGTTFAFSLPKVDSEIARKAKELLDKEASSHPDQR